MTDFDKLVERVKAAGGTLIPSMLDDEWFIDIDGYYRIVRGGDIDLWNTYLDGRDAQARARRCVKRIFADIPPPASGAAADIVAEEFGIEEAK